MRFIDMRLSARFGDDDDSIKIRQVVEWAILADARFNTDGNGIRAGYRIDESTKAEPFARLKEDDWKMLRDALENPTPMPGRQPYFVMPAARIFPLLEAIANAPEEQPVAEPVAPVANGSAAQA